MTGVILWQLPSMYFAVAYKFYNMKIYILVFFGFLLLTSACSSSRITSFWKAENAVPEKYNNILVLGLTRESDRRIQQFMEGHLAADLKELGYHTVTSLEAYGPKAFENIEEKTALEKIKDKGIDAVITIVLLDKKREKKYIPQNIYASPYNLYFNNFWGYRGTLYGRIYEPGYYVTDTRYFWESNLYDLRTQKLVYSVETESFDPANAESLGHEYGIMIIKNMLKQNVLMKRTDAAN